MKIELWISALIFIFSSTAHAASFDCNKAKSTTEKMICVNESLSRLDNLLDKNFKEELLNGSTLPEIQLSWLVNIRNKCEDIECLKKAYENRIETLKKQKDLVTWQCRNETCWWDFIKEQKIVNEVEQNKLIKVTVIRKVGSYPERLNDDEYVKKNKIVKSEEKSTGEYFAFCSKKLPFMFSCNNKFCGFATIPRINEAGQPEDSEGYDELSDVYFKVCNEINKFEVPKESNLEEIVLKNPLDVFEFYKTLK